MFWFDQKALKHITCTNLIREWDRQKIKQFDAIVNAHQQLYSELKFHSSEVKYTDINWLRGEIQKRIDRIDYILKQLSEEAKETDEILQEASKRSLFCQPPCHRKDSYRDTVNILSILAYLREKNYQECFFTTINYTDFTAAKKHELHPQLEAEFMAVGLIYIYYDINIAQNNLFQHHLKSKLPDLAEHLKAEKAKSEAQALSSKLSDVEKIEIPDDKYLQHIWYIDTILSQPEPTEVEKLMLDVILKSHRAYQQYFFKKVGDNGLV